MMNKINISSEFEIQTCKHCGKDFDDIKQYRKNICRSCWNEQSRLCYQEKSKTLDGYLHIQLNGIKNDRKRKRHECNITLDYLKELYYKQEGKCAISGIPLEIGININSPFTLSIDRIDNNLGYIEGNVHLICWAVNLFKANFKLEQVYYISERIVENISSYTEVSPHGTS